MLFHHEAKDDFCWKLVVVLSFSPTLRNNFNFVVGVRVAMLRIATGPFIELAGCRWSYVVVVVMVTFSFFAGVAIFTIDVGSLSAAIIICDVGAFGCSCRSELFWWIFAVGSRGESGEALPAVGYACG